MQQWYYAVNGQQFGPVDESMISAMAKDGKLKPGDLVWNPSFGGEWKQAAAVPGLLGGASAGAGGAAAHPDATIVIGTGGVTANRDLMALARESLSGRWGLSVGVLLVYGLICLGFGLLNVVPMLGQLVQLLMGGAFTLGLCTFFLTVARQEEAGFPLLFSGFRRFLPALGAYLLMGALVMLACLPGIGVMVSGMVVVGAKVLSGLTHASHGGMPAMPFNSMALGGTAPVALALIALGFVAAVVPAAILSLGYSLTYFILADDPGAGPVDSVFRSWRLMRGFKWKLFCLEFRFIGWALLCAIFTLGIGFLWLWPYMMVSFARFYDDIHPSDEPAPKA